MASLIGEISRAFSPELPRDLGDMDQHLDFILPKVIPYGEDLREENFWLGKRWKEVRDAEGFHEAILHIFNAGGEYLLSVDGNIAKGTWKKLGDHNTLILDLSGRSELFDLRFLNPDFLILTKHGDQGRKNQRRFFVMLNEPAARSGGRELDWRNAMEKLFNIWRENSFGLLSWVLFFIILGIVLYFSL